MKNKLNKTEKKETIEIIKKHIKYKKLSKKIRDLFLKEVYENYLKEYNHNILKLIECFNKYEEKEVISNCLTNEQKYYLDSIKFSRKVIYESKIYKLSLDNMDNLIMLSKIDIKSNYNQINYDIITTLNHCGLIKSRYYDSEIEQIKEKFLHYSLNEIIKDYRYLNKSNIDYCISDYFTY